MLRSMREPGTNRWSDAFLEEIRGFWWECLNLAIDVEFVSKPYDNGARTTLIESSLPAYEGFLRELHEFGIDPMLEKLLDSRDGFGLKATRLGWDGGFHGVQKELVYKCFVAYCEESGRKPIARNKFAAALANGTPPLEDARVTLQGKTVRVYVVPRAQNFTEDRIFSAA